MRASHWRWVEKLVTFVVAVVPATALQPWTLLGLVMGLAALLDGEFVGLLIALWSAGGIVGTLALWAVLFGSRAAWSAFGLVAGLLAILPITVSSLASIAHAPEAEDLLRVAWTLGLPVAAVYWLFRIDASHSKPEQLLLEYHPGDSHSEWP